MQFTFLLSKDPDVVFHYLTDMDKFVSVHPLIYKIDKLDHHNYKIFEKVKFGLLPYSFNYIACIKNDAENRKVGITATIKWVKMNMTFTVKPHEIGTEVVEVFQIETRLPVIGYMQKLIKDQHAQLFKNIEQDNYIIQTS